MKIVCSNCESRYSISDEKIRGRNKVFKIKCKSCGHVISIRGTDDGEGEAAAVGAEEWYIAVGGERVGPLPLSTVSDRIKAGEVTDQTFVWRQGFPDWKRAEDVPEIAAFLKAMTPGDEQELGFSGIFATEEYESAKAATAASFAQAAAAAEAESAAEEEDAEEEAPDEAAAEEAAAEDAESAALAAEEAAAEAAAEEAAEEAEEEAEAPAATSKRPDEGLFAAFDREEPADEEEDEPADTGVVSSTGEVEVGAVAGGGASTAEDDSGMVWQRHESSVLFSLDDYRGDEPAKAKVKDAEDVTDSGLIDIRAIARKESAVGPGAADVFADFAGDERRGPSSILSLDASAMPILRKKSKTPVYAILAVVVVLAAAAAVYFLVFADKPTPTPAPSGQPAAIVAEGGTPIAQPGGEAPTAGTAGAATAAAPDAGATVAAGAADAGSTAAAATPDASTAAAATAADATTGETSTTVVAAAEPGDAGKKETPAVRKPLVRARDRDDRKDDEKKPDPKRETKPEKKDPVPKDPEKKSADALLAQLQAQKKPEKKEEVDPKPAVVKGDSTLPDKLSASTIRSVVKAFDGKVKACAGSGDTDPFIRTSITIVNTGGVGAARVTSGATGSVAGCVVGVLKSMSFPKFKEPKMTVNIPFKVK